MSRSALAAALACVLAALLVPAPGSARQTDPVASEYTVVDGDTLWSLAQRFYGDPLSWTVIYEANRPLIPSPEHLETGLLLTVPARAARRTDEPAGQVPARVGAVAVQVGGSTPAVGGDSLAPVPVRIDTARIDTAQIGAAAAQPPAGAVQTPARTLFFREDRTTGLVDQARPAVVRERAPLEAIPPSVFFSAPFLLPGETAAPAADSITGPFIGDDRRSAVHSARTGDRLRLAHTGAVPDVGTRLQSYRVDRIIAGVGMLAVPTGTLWVESIGEGITIALVERHFDRIAVGDHVRVLPEAPASRAVGTDPVSSGMTADIVASALAQPVLGPGDFVFLSAGFADGVRPGDEFVPAWVPVADRPPGRLQVVLVQESSATALIVGVGEPLFQVGRSVRLDRRFR